MDRVECIVCYCYCEYVICLIGWFPVEALRVLDFVLVLFVMFLTGVE